MARASVAVLFPDGTIRYGLYIGSSDRLLPRLFATMTEPWDADNASGNRSDHWSLPDDVAPGSGEPVTIYCDYGDGTTWPGTATRDYITSELFYTDVEGDEDCHFHPPEWVRWA
jgi:hypothetical protein